MGTTFKKTKGLGGSYYPDHLMAKDFAFSESEKEEAELVDAMAVLCEKTGLTKNDLMHAIPFVLRMLKSESAWTK